MMITYDEYNRPHYHGVGTLVLPHNVMNWENIMEKLSPSIINNTESGELAIAARGYHVMNTLIMDFITYTIFHQLQADYKSHGQNI